MATPISTPFTNAPGDAWERALRTLAQTLLRWAAGHAQRRAYAARRQRVAQARRARRLERADAQAARRALARQLSPRLRRDLGL